MKRALAALACVGLASAVTAQYAGPAVTERRAPPLLLPPAADISANAFRLRYIAFRAAVDASEEALIKSMLSPDFVNVDVAGRPEPLSKWLGVIAFADAPPPGNRRTSEVVSLSVRGGEARVQERYTTETPYPTSYGPSYRRWTVLSNDVWRRSASGWRLWRSESQEAWRYCDDRLVSHEVAPAYRSPSRQPVVSSDAGCQDYDLSLLPGYARVRVVR